MYKNIVNQRRSQITIWRMRIVCWLLEATNTFAVYVILLFHCNNGFTNTPQYIVTRTMRVLLSISLADLKI